MAKKTHRGKYNARSAKVAQRKESQAKAAETGLPASLSDDDSVQGQERNTKIIRTAMTKGYAVPEEMKPVLVDVQIQHALNATKPKRALYAFKALASAELREREVRVREQEAEIKGQLAAKVGELVDAENRRLTREEVLASACELLEAGIGDGVRCPESHTAGAAVPSHAPAGFLPRSVVPVSPESDGESRSVAG